MIIAVNVSSVSNPVIISITFQSISKVLWSYLGLGPSQSIDTDRPLLWSKGARMGGGGGNKKKTVPALVKAKTMVDNREQQVFNFNHVSFN